MKTENEIVFLDPAPSDDRRTKIVVRLRTTYWHDADGIYSRQSVKFLRSQCEGFNLLHDEACNIGAEDTLGRLNHTNCKDGLYEIVIIPDRPDYETGYSEDWEYELRPYVIKKP